MPQAQTQRGRCVSRGTAGALACLLLGLTVPASAQGTPAESPVTVITNLTQFWVLSSTAGEKEYPVLFPLRVHYYDPAWNVLWVGSEDGGSFLGTGKKALPLKSGQVVELDGVARPGKHEIVWDRTKIRVLDGAASEQPIPLPAEEEQFEALDLRLVEVEGLVSDQVELGSAHLRLDLISDGTLITVYVLIDPEAPVPQFSSAFVRILGLFSVKRDGADKIAKFETWVAETHPVEVISWLSEDSRFQRPSTAIEQLGSSPSKALARVEGKVQSREPGKSLTVRDETGQVRLLTAQKQYLEVGDRVEAIGVPDIDGLEPILRRGLFRLLTDAGGAQPAATNRGLPRLRLTAQVRELRAEEAARGYPARLSGVVTGSDPLTQSFFLQDGSGAVKVRLPKDGSIPLPHIEMGVVASGSTQSGDFVPVLACEELAGVGEKVLPAAHPVTLDEILTGAKYARWVEMEGYLRSVVSEGPQARVEITASGGEFVAYVPADDQLQELQGAVVRIRGVWDAIANERRQLVGVRFWVPSREYIQVQEAAPADLFAVPRRSVASLLQFNAANGLNRRVRVGGVILFHRAGEFFYLQDGNDSVRVLSRQKAPLFAGDRVEVVGFPGHQGLQLLMREGAYRVTGAGLEPEPVPLRPAEGARLELDGKLVHVEGTLLELAHRSQETRLQILADGVIFEATWEGRPGSNDWPTLQEDSVLGLTGVYRVRLDEYQQPRGFLLNLRSPRDLTVLDRPSWWTAARIVRTTGAISMIGLTAAVWGALLSRKNRLLRRAQRDLRTANDELESRVEARTRALKQEITERKRVELDVEQTHKRLLVVSRQAGMAEVATGVLHNVGNVLNSVNISATLVSDHLRNSRVSGVAKAAALIREHAADPGGFLKDDPRGKELPNYLDRLADHLAAEQRGVLAELESLNKNIGHIKEIVAVHQSYAKVSGVVESVHLPELVEDALRIHTGALARHEVRVRHEFDPGLPPILTERHRVLQILVNLVHNAKYACDASGRSDKLLTVRVTNGDNRVRVAVMDNGVGIAAENLTRVFNHGFTTRKGGHGFGLHSGALAAKELGGSLSVDSEGPGQGAKFTLELPIQPRQKRLGADASESNPQSRG